MLGYITSLNGLDISYIQPSLDVMVSRIWQGSTHMGSIIGLLSQQEGHTYPVTIHVSVVGRIIDGALAKLVTVWVLDAAWSLLLFG